jgi:thioredoxin-like negative regulator of GroEL
MIFITDETELSFLWKEHPIHGLYFYRSDMPFHAKMLNVIAQIQEKYPSILFYALDADQFTGPCIRFSVQSVPALVVLKEAKEVKRIEGSVKTQEFIDLFDDICIP